MIPSSLFHQRHEENIYCVALFEEWRELQKAESLQMKKSASPGTNMHSTTTAPKNSLYHNEGCKYSSGQSQSHIFADIVYKT